MRSLVHVARAGGHGDGAGRPGGMQQVEVAHCLVHQDELG